MIRKKSTIETANGDVLVLRKSRSGKRISEVTISFPEDKSEIKVLMKLGKNGTQKTESFALNGMISFFVTEAGEPEVIVTV